MESIGSDTVTETLMLTIEEERYDENIELTITASPDSFGSYVLLIDGKPASLYSDKAKNIFLANVDAGVHTFTLIVEVEGESYSYTKDITITVGD